MAGKLTLVGTPIGNLSDMSPRAVQALEACDFIAAEDTRVTIKLLNHFGIKKPMVSYYEHNKRERGSQICSRIEAGENCVLVTDAGMPAISDPGEDMVVRCKELGIQVGVVPGPSAVITALAVSGLPSGRFAFEGFLSMNRKNRKEHLEAISDERRTMIFYEAPHKLSATLNDLHKTLGERQIAIVRELTKLHEEVIRTTLSKAAERFGAETPKGEIVLIIEGAPPPAAPTFTLSQAASFAAEFMEQGMSASEAAKRAAAKTGVKKGDIYREITI
ncbi:MAG: 16S rRNA (cytidine(1402)-2'-O)-methyltransferase [Oscillospiraceae bacterium]|nr:16S rRNA (cytidine(1402)-2'-O)-methyltransferase [Oscillospiraceae bacterium]MDD3833224.1 16S rRNA (cytidine(1402)-2'-O)-methyltransferase [Oscillospiraceae bacterium]MDD4545811.1 16S rRNA (cytidine(1402)-2'-O)-methyltransferase [Oscillospiraceae bacterium]